MSVPSVISLRSERFERVISAARDRDRNRDRFRGKTHIDKNNPQVTREVTPAHDDFLLRFIETQLFSEYLDSVNEAADTDIDERAIVSARQDVPLSTGIPVTSTSMDGIDAALYVEKDACTDTSPDAPIVQQATRTSHDDSNESSDVALSTPTFSSPMLQSKSPSLISKSTYEVILVSFHFNSISSRDSSS